jgi:hypothetical protein
MKCQYISCACLRQGANQEKECLNSTYYDNFTKFRDAISGFVDNMHITHAGEASRLLTLNFQLFTPEQVLKAA